MPIPENKEQLVLAIRFNYQSLRADLCKVPDRISRHRLLDGHVKNSTISVCDLVAYLIGWGKLVLKWIKNKDRAKHVDMPETGYKWNELGKLAEKFYLEYGTLPYSKLLDTLDLTNREILELVEAKTNAELYHVDWYGKWTLGRMIQLNTSSPYRNARNRLRKLKKLR